MGVYEDVALLYVSFLIAILVCAHAYELLYVRVGCRRLPCVARSEQECVVCLERIESGRKAPCGHVFHEACLSKWVEQTNACPICRRHVIDEVPLPVYHPSFPVSTPYML